MEEKAERGVYTKNDHKEESIVSVKNAAAVSKPNNGNSVTRVFVVLNPVAGLTNAENAKDRIDAFCKDHQWECDLHETAKDEDLRKLVRDRIKQGVDMVIVAGGDGTVSAVVSGMANSKVPMGVLPAGTGNALARDLGIPLDLQGALNLLGGEHEVRTMDLMEVNKDFYVLNVSVGISSQIMRKTKRNEKRRFGMLAYIWRGLGSIKNSRQRRFEVKVDGKPYRIHASEVMIVNSRLIGMQSEMNRVVIDPNDSRLDMFILRAQGIRDFLNVLVEFVLNRPAEESSKLRYLEIHNTAEIRCEMPLPAQADGEVIGNTPLDVRLIPSALRVIAPIPNKPNK